MSESADLVILFADVVGSSALYKLVGDAAARQLVAESLNAVAQLVAVHQGKVVKTIGDEIMCYFESPELGVLCAIQIQQRMHQLEKIRGEALAMRVGLHYGAALKEQGDIFGDAVNTASRMAPIANPKQIVTTQATIDVLPEHLKGLAKPFDSVKIKAFARPVKLYIIDWTTNDDADATVLVNAAHDDQPLGARLFLRCGESRQQIGEDVSSFVVGRDQQKCDLALNSRYASRKHMWIEFQHGKFVLVDHSTNGTWVKTQDGNEIFLRREEIPLWGTGMISLGRPFGDSTEDCINFVVDEPA